MSQKYHPYTSLSHHDDDSDNDYEDQMLPSQQQPNTNNNCMTNLLKHTAHRRLRHSDTIININEEDEVSTDVISRTSGLDDIDLIASNSQQTKTDSFKHDDFVVLLFLDETKKKVGIMNSWKIRKVKAEYFFDEVRDGKNVRLIYRGKLLQDSLQLSAYNIASNAFIHVSVSKSGNSLSHKNDGTTVPLMRQSSELNYDNFDDGMDDEALARTLHQTELELDRQRQPLHVSEFGRNESNNQDEIELNASRARGQVLC